MQAHAANVGYCDVTKFDYTVVLLLLLLLPFI